MSNTSHTSSSKNPADKQVTGFDRSFNSKESFRIPALPQFTRLPSVAEATSPHLAPYRNYETSINNGIIVLDTENDEDMDEQIRAE